MTNISQAIIMCGGKGTRIKNLTKDLIPKSMIKFNQKYFLEILIKKIYDAGISRIIFCTGHHSDQISKFINEFSHLNKNMNIDLLISKEKMPLGTAGALKLCSKLLYGRSSIILNGDTYVNYDLKKYINWHLKKKYEISIMLSFVINSLKYGSVKIVNQKVKKFEEKKLKFFKYVYNGVFISENEFLEKIDLKFSNVEDTFFQDNIEKIYGFKTFCKFYDIGSISGYDRAQKFLNI